MCGGLSLRPARSEGAIAARISAMLLLQEALRALPPLAEALAGARCELLQARSAGGCGCASRDVCLGWCGGSLPVTSA